MKKYIYRLGVKNNKITSVLSNEGVGHFVAPVTKRNKKIYLVAKDSVVHYIGITRQPIGNRLKKKPVHKTGYHGYKWLKDSGKHYLIVWVFEKNTDVEAIEAEIVYYFRKQNDQWPRYQTEIHFHTTTPGQRALAKKILTETQRIVRKIT